MKKLFILALFQFVVSDLAYGLVKLKDVTQKGAGSTGTIRIEFNGDYKRSKADIEYKEDHVEILMKDAFSLPPNRVFKVSSEKSSVSKISSKLVPGNLIRLSIYFKIPLDIVKRTANIEVNRNILKFTYKTTVDEGDVQDETASAAQTTEQTNIKDEGLDAYYKAINDNGAVEAPEQQDEEPVVAPDVLKDDKKTEAGIKRLWGILKGAFILVLVVAFSIAVFYLYKKYSSGMSESLETPFGMKDGLGRMAAAQKPVVNKPVVNNNIPVGIKVLSSLSLDHGKTVHVVEYMGEKMLIATSKDSVTLLSRLDAKSPLSNDEPDLFKNTKFKDRFGSDF